MRFAAGTKRWNRCIPVLLWCNSLLIAAPSYAAQDPLPSCISHFRALTQGSIKSNGTLPDVIVIRSVRKDSRALFSAMEALWKTDVKLKELQPMIERLAKTPLAMVTSEEKARLKAARKASAIYRSGFQLFDKRHAAPQDLDRFVTAFGKLNDAIEADDPNVDLQKPARKLLEAMKRLARVSHFELSAADRDSFAENLGLNLKQIRKWSRKPGSLSATHLHELRKRLKLFMNYFQVRQAVEPDEGSVPIYNELFAINEELGALHDASVKTELTGQAKYEAVQLELSPELRQRILNFTERLTLKH